MGENSKIEWTDHTFNPWVGCTKVSAACDHCYAEGWAKRTGHAELWNGDRRRTSSENWQKPLKWDKAAAAAGERHRVFCASLADVFDNQVPVEWRYDLFRMIGITPHLDWLLLTKRPQNIRKMLPSDWEGGLQNVWLGTTAENQEEYDRRYEGHLQEIPACVRFISYEPALGPLSIRESFNRPDWVIAGGESGGKARPADVQWFRDLQAECERMRIPFLFKQHGEHLDGVRVGKKRAGRLLDGVEWNQFPQGRL